jgi:tRNA threonylcarbamoyladenosine biosynthesis protein TsaE
VATTTSPRALELITSSAEETEQAASRLARSLRRGDLLLLVGELGAGKTTFVRGLARGMGLPAHVMSPTFQLVRLYPGPVPLAHVDLYRLEGEGELDDLGLEELLDEGVVVVEWGDRLRGLEGVLLSLETLDADRRRLLLEGAPADWSL